MPKQGPKQIPSFRKSRRSKLSDRETTVAELKRGVEEFVLERDWVQFHSPKNLAMAIGVEAGELMDLFRWHSDSQSVEAMRREATRKAVCEELADVIICALSFANRTGIDVASEVSRKLRHNKNKYPVHLYRGRF